MKLIWDFINSHPRLTDYSYLDIGAGNIMVEFGVNQVQKLRAGNVSKPVKAPLEDNHRIVEI
ncbi:MAG: hypothetical protein WD431_23325 [Cyclobacteriaceae bacterium]